MFIDVYDPNHCDTSNPAKTSTIRLQTRAPNNQIYARQTTPYPNSVSTEKVRGFFVTPIGSGISSSQQEIRQVWARAHLPIER